MSNPENPTSNTNIENFNAEDFHRIFTEGTPEEIEAVRIFYGLSAEAIDRWGRFVRLRKETLNKKKEDIKQREKNNPRPSKDEWEMGCFIEEIEPQVRDAVLKIRKKGYNTSSSGFFEGLSQAIAFKPILPESIGIPGELIDDLKRKGVEIFSTRKLIKISFSRFFELNEIKQIWDLIADAIPDSGNSAKAAESGTDAIRFREKYPINQK